METTAQNEQNSNILIDIITKAIKLPYVKIDRETYLRTVLQKYADIETVNKAVEFTPYAAGITADEINKIAQKEIEKEAGKVTALSFLTGLPGGAAAMVGASSIDLIQFYGHVLRILQKLVYLYGWQDLASGDTDTKSWIIIFLGLMFGVGAAAEFLDGFSRKITINVMEKIEYKALQGGMFYPLIKKVASKIGLEISEKNFAKSIGGVIPVLGGFASGSMSNIMFRRMSSELKSHLSEMI